MELRAHIQELGEEMSIPEDTGHRRKGAHVSGLRNRCRRATFSTGTVHGMERSARGATDPALNREEPRAMRGRATGMFWLSGRLSSQVTAGSWVEPDAKVPGWPRIARIKLCLSDPG